MDVSIPILTKLDNKCGKQYLCLVILQIIKEAKTAFLQDGILYRPDTV